jgi:hypothetical protein
MVGNTFLVVRRRSQWHRIPTSLWMGMDHGRLSPIPSWTGAVNVADASCSSRCSLGRACARPLLVVERRRVDGPSAILNGTVIWGDRRLNAKERIIEVVDQRLGVSHELAAESGHVSPDETAICHASECARESRKLVAKLPEMTCAGALRWGNAGARGAEHREKANLDQGTVVARRPRNGLQFSRERMELAHSKVQACSFMREDRRCTDGWQGLHDASWSSIRA